MTETLGPATLLDAVNEMMSVIGQSPLNTLTSPSPDAATALGILYRTSRDLQEEGWTFNTETDVTILLDADNKLPIPADVLKIDGLDSNLIERGRFLYDVDENSFTHEAETTVTLVRHLPWDELTTVTRRYVIALARIALAGPMPGADIARANETLLVFARRAFKESESDNGDYNLLTGSLSVSTMLRRGQ